MYLKNILKAFGGLFLATLTFAVTDGRDFSGECDELAKTFASHKGGNYSDLFQCGMNDDGKVNYIIVGDVPSEKVGNQYIEDISKLKALNNLCLYNVVFEGMNFEPLKNAPSLEKINIDVYKFKPLTEIPETFYSLTNLTSLAISVQKITKISDKIGDLENLESLHITSTPITEIPKTITKLTKLRSLSFGDTDIKKFPKEIAELKNLEQLHLDSCNIDDTIPESYNTLTNLKEIDFAGNKNVKGKTLTLDLENCTYGNGISDDYKELCIAVRTSCLLRNKTYPLCSGEVDDPIKVSTDGTCGEDTYTKCPEGLCCSKYGYCGTSEKHCSTLLGCQSEFGKCTTYKISQDDRCGKDFGNTHCPAGECCSKYGWCGTSDRHCSRSSGCQSEFGQCHGSDKVPVGTKDKCGKGYGKCGKGKCCSKYGWCGKGDAYCAAGCQKKYGLCN